MVFDPANVAKGFLGGVAAGQQQQARGLDIERMRKEATAKEAQERKRGQISGLLGQFVGGTGDRQQITGQLAGLGAPGVQALQTGTEFLQSQRDVASEQLKRSSQVMLEITNPEEWQQAAAWAAPVAVEAGLDQKSADLFKNMSMEQGQNVLRRILGGEKKPARTALESYLNPDTGKVITLDENKPEDVARIRREGLVEAPSRQIVGKPEDFATNKVADEMAKNEAATSNFIADIYEAQDFIRSNPAALTDVAGLSRIATNISANIDALRDSFDVELDDESVLRAENYEPTFKVLGIASAEMKSIMIGLATQQAIINNPDGKISDRDVKDAMVQIGSSVQTPEGFIKVSDRLAKRAVRVFKTRYKTRSKGKKAFEGDLGLREEIKEKNISTMSLKELEGLTNLTEEERSEASNRWKELRGVR